MYVLYVCHTEKYFVEFPTEKDVERWHFLFRLVNRHVSFLLGKFSRGACSIQKSTYWLLAGMCLFVKATFQQKNKFFLHGSG